MTDKMEIKSMSRERQKPKVKLQAGNKSVSVFENEKGGNSFVLQIGYKQEGEWKHKEISIFDSEIDTVIAMLKGSREIVTSEK